MAKISAREALEIWRAADLLTRDKTEELEAYLARVPSSPKRRVVAIFATIGAILVGLGILLFVGSNWAKMSPLFRVGVLFASYAVAAGCAATAQRREREMVARALWFLVTLIFGANIFLIGQLFHFTLTFWQGPFLWLIGTLAMGYAIKSQLHAWTAIPLTILTLGWLGGGAGWFMDDQLEFLWSSAGLRPIFGAVGLGFAALALIAGRSSRWGFAQGTWLAWGGWLITLPLAISTFDPNLFVALFDVVFTMKQLGILTGVALLVVAAMWSAVQCRPWHRAFPGVVLAVLLALVAHDATGKPWLAPYLKTGGPFFVYAVAVFGLALTTVWIGVARSNRHLVNVGIGGAALVIAGQYFSWSFRLLDRSLAFIVGGIVLILLSVFIERQRKRLLSGMDA